MKINLWKILPFKAVDVAVAITKVLTGAQAVFSKHEDVFSERQKIFFANHSSNMDTIILWAALPSELRAKTRPVAALDYWGQPGIKSHIGKNELNVVLVDRKKQLDSTKDPLEPLIDALKEGSNLIIFPEGQRNKSLWPLEFKSGLYRLKKEFPNVDLIPIYLENTAKTFPKGALVPLPVICRAYFGKKLEELTLVNGELDKVEFLKLARKSILDLMPLYVKKLYEKDLYLTKDETIIQEN